MGSRPKLLYVDADSKRARGVAEVLTAAGFVVWTCPEHDALSPRRAFERPDFVLISDQLPSMLEAAAAELWPNAPVLRVARGDKEGTILEKLTTYLK